MKKILTIIFLLWTSIVFGATHYVSPTGSDTWANSTSISTPCSPTTAMTNAVAGDIVYFRGGVYTLTGPNPTDHGILEPSNGGTSGSPITFMAYTGETPVMDCQISSGVGCMSLGNNVHDYIIWDGFTLKTNSGAKKGGMYMKYCTGCIARNNTFIGGTEVPTYTDNSDGLRIDYTSYSQVYQNTFTHYRETNNYQNTSAIKTYHNDHLTFRNNEISDCSCGLFLKSTTSDSTISYNYIHDNYIGSYTSIFISQVYNSPRLKWYHNVFANNSYSSMGMDTDGDAYADDWEIYNNTIYGSARGIGWMGTSTKEHGAIIYNNIVQGAANLQLDGMGTSGLVEEDYNQWGTASFKIIIRYYQVDQGTYTSLASWQASTELASGGHPGTGDLVSDPLFTNGSGNLNLLSDFTLASNSPCKGTGKAGVDMGADISLVGTGAEPPTYYTVTPSAGAGGSINPSSPQSIVSGQTTQFTVTPNEGYSISSITGTCGGSGTSTYTTSAITADCTVIANFTVINATVTLGTGTINATVGSGSGNWTLQ